MKQNIHFAFLFFTLLSASCTFTRITSSWREPDKQVTINELHKVLVVAIFKDETSRHKAEDQWWRTLTGKA